MDLCYIGIYLPGLSPPLSKQSEMLHRLRQLILPSFLSKRDKRPTCCGHPASHPYEKKTYRQAQTLPRYVFGSNRQILRPVKLNSFGFQQRLKRLKVSLILMNLARGYSVLQRISREVARRFADIPFSRV
jgi:hypothetical protein